MIAIIASIFNPKAKLWVNGRKLQKVTPAPKSIWFHFASLGEFEQGRPVLEAVKAQYVAHQIIVTFFSPSGYEIRKNTPLADAVYYLPLDTAANARRFIDTIKPSAAIFTKYEYWYHYFNQLHKRQIPLYVISAIFRPQQIFFKWYGGLHRQILKKVTRLFVQDAESVQLLAKLGLTNAMVSGDTRFDRVYTNAAEPRALPVIEAFAGQSPVFVAGSTWPPDEELIVSLVDKCPHWKFIIAPHETGEDKINKLNALLPAGKAMRFSELDTRAGHIPACQVLVIDNVGMLSSLYQYGQVAYIGGGFGVGIHNTLEAAAFGLPVIFGPNYKRFKEARNLVALQGGFSISNAQQLQQITRKLITDDDYRQTAGATARKYVADNKGATEKIMSSIKVSNGL